MNRPFTRWLSVALIILALDRLTKFMVLRNFMPGEALPVAHFLNLVLAYNRGAAFSFLADANGWQRWIFTAIGLIAALLITHLLRKYRDRTLFCFALSLILGGALGNVIDRLLHGHVIDFLDFYLRGWHWPAFNLADSAISCGAALLVLDELRRARRP
ncbi:Lipoprotein signal peptidase (Prolipoprotein signal peptidase) (Signal peptidase II) (SPase II) [Candidatus Glomeribacter gigasporarum BEG34]|uniref:Lipoprotein signal peptidase n=1 Tax=Candidatus Glomeribacter gigasporarum BEG34 TaxID=1070319 RepID=G2J8W9_9BURK|nr:signal peptidase II [Candidatus Glomeribacter gigasporarum]CCD29216.1 Lipoprotein signal peptidase (Prolipoprotein signal peptidase) (Signal peptidase II) (SPase II) [Candidatus Glomeribacter gigasporarum BEG34]